MSPTNSRQYPKPKSGDEDEDETESDSVKENDKMPAWAKGLFDEIFSSLSSPITVIILPNLHISAMTCNIEVLQMIDFFYQSILHYQKTILVWD